MQTVSSAEKVVADLEEKRSACVRHGTELQDERATLLNSLVGAQEVLGSNVFNGMLWQTYPRDRFDRQRLFGGLANLTTLGASNGLTVYREGYDETRDSHQRVPNGGSRPRGLDRG